ncbi:hypothetical protein GW17_00016503 [Ensete ventricosum]|nr:hypothetical protein GW17_00016503 [Ensete ventricosum]
MVAQLCLGCCVINLSIIVHGSGLSYLNRSFHGTQINDRYEFPLQLDLDNDNGKYLSPEADRRVRNLYTLHRGDIASIFLPVRGDVPSPRAGAGGNGRGDPRATARRRIAGEGNDGARARTGARCQHTFRNWFILKLSGDVFVLACSVLVHSGGVHGGHYYAFIRPTLSDQWYLVGQLREVSNKAHNAELKLFLEVELGPDLCPVPPPPKTKEDILLFFKLYDPEKEELRYHVFLDSILLAL